jgi:hypothetical protein
MRSWARFLIGGCALLTIVSLSLSLRGAQETVAFDSGRWTVASGGVREFLGRKAFQGTAFLNDVSFSDGTIEADIAVASDRQRSYPGILFRIGPGQSWERFYIRPHRQSLYPDTLQYVPAFNGVDSWQLYSGPGYTALAAIPVNAWFHVRIEVAGTQARVFLGDSRQPALEIPVLRHGRGAGGLGIMGPVDGSSFFSNFSFRSGAAPAFAPIPLPDPAPGAVSDWQVSKPFPALRIAMDKTPSEQKLGDPAWTPIRADPTGLVDIGRLYPRSGEPDAVFARTTLTAEKDETRRFDFGYSDIVSVFLNGRLIFEANSQYQGRDPSFLGIAGYFDSLHLPLKRGPNELLLAVAEISGGWGFMAREGTAEFAFEGLKKIWETPRSFSIPESAAFDGERSCFYVSNYDGYRPSPAEGRQSVSKISLDGTVLDLEWVKGLRNPTGLCLVGDRLWAVERAALAEIDVPGARILRRIALPEARMPNDVAAAPDGSLYVTDSVRSAVYKVSGDQAEVWLAGPEVGRPNGIAVDGASLIVGTNLDGCLKAVDMAAKSVRTIVRFGPGIIDGIQVIQPGRYLVSHNEGRLYLVTEPAPGDGRARKILDLTVVGRNIADFAWYREKDRSYVVFPSYTDNRVTAYVAPPHVFTAPEARPASEMIGQTCGSERKPGLSPDASGRMRAS